MRQPVGDVAWPEAGMLLGKDTAEAAANPARQRPVGPRPVVEASGVADAGDELADLPACRLVGVHHARCLERAARGQQIQDPALDGEPQHPGRVHREPRHAATGQRDGPAVVTRLDA